MVALSKENERELSDADFYTVGISLVLVEFEFDNSILI